MAKQTKQAEALRLLDDLDNLSVSEIPKNSSDLSSNAPPAGQAAEVLAFIDEVTLKSSEPTAKSSTARITISRPDSRSSNSSPLKKRSVDQPKPVVPVTSAPSSPANTTEPNSWGWGSVWSSTTAAIQQARTIVDDQVKTISSTEQARKLQDGVLGYVKNAQLEKIGSSIKGVSLSTFTDILNAVAPPISQHEVLRVLLSHDLVGYDGLESIVYQALSQVMEQVDGGELVVNNGQGSKPKASSEKSREINAVDGADAARKLAAASLDELIKSSSDNPDATEPTTQNPTTNTSLYLRIQPFSTMAPGDPGDSETLTVTFMLYLVEPSHKVSHFSITQAFPKQWLDVWDTNEWVEDLIVDTLRLGIRVVGQQYIISRMGLSSKLTTKGLSTSASS